MRHTLWQRLRPPGLCTVCGSWSPERVCDACSTRFAPPVARCVRCARATAQPVCGACLRAPPPFDAAYAAVSYGYPWDGLLLRFKFQGEPALVHALAALWDGHAGLRAALADATLVLPMPLSPARLRERGFNQALLLARALAGRSRCDAGLLLRTRDTPAQSALPRADRLRNVRGAFAVAPLRAAALRGARVLLVDDVMTSGASLSAASAALRDAGAAHVACAVVARTED